MNIVVGSKALQKFGYNRREPLDVDVWIDMEDIWLKGEQGIDEVLMPSEIMDIVPNERGYATPDAVYTIKCSHFGWDIKWEKTKKDILWLKSKGCKLIPELYTALVDHWKEEHGNKDFLSLSKNKDGFFNDHVTYVYDHDYLHELVAHPNEPTYNKCLKDGEQVLVDKNKFENMVFEDKIRMFKEEIAVIASERWLINPYWQGKVNWVKAWELSLQKTITNLTKNWATDFIVLNLEHFCKPDYSYFKHLISKVGDDNMSAREELVAKLLPVSEEAETSMAALLYLMAEGDVCFNGDAENMLAELGYEHIHQEGGGEGGSEYCEGVFKLDDKLYEVNYSYYSHNGCEYDYIEDTIREVKPVVKTVTVYE